MDTKNGSAKPFTIVVGVDYSELSELAIERAIDTARSHEHCRLHVVHVSGATAGAPYVGAVVGPDPTEESERLHAHLQMVLTRCAPRVPKDHGPIFERVTLHIRFYDAAEAISRVAGEVEADLIVVGTHGRRGMQRFLLGSVAESTVRRAPCPVLVVRPVGSHPEAATPQIEPPCPRCVETRAATDGRELWCAQHREMHDRRHTYHLSADRSSHQSGLLFPF